MTSGSRRSRVPRAPSQGLRLGSGKPASTTVNASSAHLAARPPRSAASPRLRGACPGRSAAVWARRASPTLPLGGPDRALAGPPGALLAPGLLAAAGHFAAALRVVGPRTPVGELPHHRLMEQRPVDLRRTRRFQLDVAAPCPACRRLTGGIAIISSPRPSARLRDLHALAHEDEGAVRPGTAPRTSSRFCSGMTRTTLRFNTVRRSPPMRPGSWWPARRGTDPRRRRWSRGAVEHRAVGRLAALPVVALDAALEALALRSPRPRRRARRAAKMSTPRVWPPE